MSKTYILIATREPDAIKSRLLGEEIQTFYKYMDGEILGVTIPEGRDPMSQIQCALGTTDEHLVRGEFCCDVTVFVSKDKKGLLKSIIQPTSISNDPFTLYGNVAVVRKDIEKNVIGFTEDDLLGHVEFNWLFNYSRVNSDVENPDDDLLNIDIPSFLRMNGIFQEKKYCTITMEEKYLDLFKPILDGRIAVGSGDCTTYCIGCDLVHISHEYPGEEDYLDFLDDARAIETGLWQVPDYERWKELGRPRFYDPNRAYFTSEAGQLANKVPEIVKSL